MTQSSYTPHQPLPGYVLRWTKQAFELLMRHPLPWGLLAIASWLAVLATGPRLIPSVVLPWFIIHIGTALARWADGNRQLPAFSFSGFVRAVGLTEAIPLLLVCVLILPKNTTMIVHTATPTTLSGVVLMSALIYMAFRSIPFVGSPFTMLHYVVARVSIRDNVRQALALTQLPLKLQLALVLVPVVTVMVSSYITALLIPAATILLFTIFPLWGAFLYVAYREIFWQFTENQSVQAREVSSMPVGSNKVLAN